MGLLHTLCPLLVGTRTGGYGDFPNSLRVSVPGNSGLPVLARLGRSGEPRTYASIHSTHWARHSGASNGSAK